MKLSHRFSTVILAVCLIPISGVCADGNKLLAQLQSKENWDNIQAYNYILGIIDYEALLVIKEAVEIGYPMKGEKKTKFSMPLFCPPDGATGKQAMDIVQGYLEANPAIRQQGALGFVRKSLVTAWPCKGNEDSSESAKK